MISGIGLGKSFDEEWILRDVDLCVQPGEVLGIIGPGGAGKSVLLKLLCGLIRPDTGRVEVEGADLATLSALETARVRDRFGMLFQNYALFDFMTVGENVGFPLTQQGVDAAEIKRRVAARLAQVELPDTQELFPNQLSGGMKKRVSLARATIAEAPLLLYDDPTAGLDPVTSSKIFALIGQLHSKAGATIIVSHDVDRMMAVCDRWLLIHEARVYFQGSTEEAMASKDEVVRVFFDLGLEEGSR